MGMQTSNFAGGDAQETVSHDVADLFQVDLARNKLVRHSTGVERFVEVASDEGNAVLALQASGRG